MGETKRDFKMPLKGSLDKQAWQWAESTTPSDITEENVFAAYRINQKKCHLGGCRRNCKGNPFCLNCLGEKVWLGEIDERKWHDIEEPDEERRTPGSFVGLKNLGATCYVNTFLQLWFHNPEVRRAMYLWDDSTDNSQDPSKPEEWSPSSVCGQLQLMFALLEFSNRKYIDPSSFINCLGLNAAEQQDAQEFCKLFLSVLEDSLAQHGDPQIQSLIQGQFCGQYAYLTRCSACSNTSKTPSKFFELDLNIKGNKTVEACIEEFLKVEKMDGDNQYMCEKCNKKQNATREIQLETLPRVLNLQLLRFVFDRNTGHKKKLNNFIQFSESLDISKYMKQPEGTVLYELTAVLIHRGPSAYSGHYVAHIRDKESKSWYKFNDEEIERMEGRNLKLGAEEDIPGADGDKPNKKPRTSKGSHNSKNAYMLVYTRQESPQQIAAAATAVPAPSSELPSLSLLSEKVRVYVDRDNEKFEEYISELLNMRDQSIQTGRVKQEVVRQIYTELHVQEDGAFEWLSHDWLSKWLTDPSTAPIINHNKYLCSHKHLHPDKVSKLKCVSEKGADQLFDRYSGGPRLKKSSLCWKCVRRRCELIQNKIHIDEDSKFISSALKSNCESEDSYWVGKSSLRSWRRLATEQMNAVLEENGIDEGMSDTSGDVQGTSKGRDGQEPLQEDVEDIAAQQNGEIEEDNKENGAQRETTFLDSGGKCGMQTTTTSSSNVKTDERGDAKLKLSDDDESSLKFNHDLLCGLHGDLSPDANCRRLVPAEVWLRFRTYFQTCPEYRKLSPICLQCQSLSQQEQEVKLRNKNLAAEQKSAMLNIFYDRNRPNLLQKSVDHLFVVSSMALEEWRNFIRDPLKQTAVISLSNASLFCPHQGLLFQVQLDTALTDSRLYLLWPVEWEILKTLLQVDTEIQVRRNTNEGAQRGWTSTPGECEACVKSRVQLEENERYNYSDAVVYVRKLTSEKSAIPGQGNNLQLNDLNKMETDDPDFIQAQSGNLKRKKPLLENGTAPLKVPHLQESLVRKSHRHRRMRGEKQVTISSSHTLKELKVKIMNVFSVAPFDQTLILDGRALTEDTATLNTLRVPPGAVLLLKADEPEDESMVIEDLYKVSSRPESGFKGTGLLNR